MGAFFLMNLCARILAGTLAERIGNVPTALVGAGLGTIGGLFYLGSPRALDLIFLARLFHGVGAGLVSAGVLIHLIETVPSQLRGRMMGYFGLPGFLMLGAAPFLSEFLQSRWGIQATFYVVLLTFVLAALPLLALPRPLVPRKRLRKFSRAMKVNLPRLRSILVFSFLFGLCVSSWQSFLAPAVGHLGTRMVSAFGLGYGTGALTSRLGISRTLEQGRRRLIAISGLVPFGLLLAVLPHMDRPWSFATVGFLCGAIHGVYYPALSSIAAERFHALVPGHGLSLYISASSIGLFIGPPLWGILADHTNYIWMFAAAGAILASATCLYVASEWGR